MQICITTKRTLIKAPVHHSRLQTGVKLIYGTDLMQVCTREFESSARTLTRE